MYTRERVCMRKSRCSLLVFFFCFVFKTGFVELAFDSQGSVVYAFALGHHYFCMLIKSCTCKILKVLVLYYGHS